MTRNVEMCIVLTSTLARQQSNAAALARRLNLPVERSFDNSALFHLVYTDIRLELQQNPGRRLYKEKPIFADFLQGNAIHPRLRTATIRDPLCRAAGLRSGFRPSIVDATAGLGMDAMTLAILGCQVTMMERSAVIHALLEDGLERAAQHVQMEKVVHERVTLLQGNAIDLLQRAHPADTVLVDPMYPCAGRTALNRKEMRMLRDIVGDDSDSRELFFAALQAAARRVVVKRPKAAPCIVDHPPPSHQVVMKSGRFDVYLKS